MTVVVAAFQTEAVVVPVGRSLCTGTLPASTFRHRARVRQVHELVEHGELELQLDAVQHGLDGCFPPT